MNTALPAWPYLLIALALAVPARAQYGDPFLSAPSRPHTVAPRPAAPAPQAAPQPQPQPQPQAQPQPQPQAQPGTPEALLQQGNAAMRRQDYAAAEAAARTVLKVRHSPLAVDAHFLLAQAFIGLGDYSHAADAYDDAYGDARTGPRAQEALLGRAKALATLGKTRNVCSVLDTLKKEFPAPRPDLVGQINAMRQQAACR